MARPKNAQPTDGELEILKHLWNAGPCPLGQVCSLIREERAVATTTVATMLAVMLAKGLVNRSRGPRGYLWSAKTGRETTTRQLVDRFVDRTFDGSAHLLVTHLMGSQKLSLEERRQVLELLQRGAVETPKSSSVPPTASRKPKSSS